ncbi:alpha/beta hydrolase family protein [Gimesia aquarii]|uniref:Prolyl oligopeptidase family protein n=1 Tax=Gimesia aquarii TaxID=2527964 RepID=A0A517WX19_9PLAN|nr:prolyl oligopeptidase family serine peptidase [Gimesia aquarii]QDU09794.1 Prolyl oligopeptidase family protein [Gimesia aquarii]
MLRFFGLVICFLASVSWLMASGQKQVESKRTPVYQEHLDLSYYLDQKGGKQPIKTWNDWEKRRSHILANMQTVMGELPHPVKPIPLDMKVLEENTIGSTKRFKISYHTDDPKQRVHAYLFVPQSATKQHPVPSVLCLHQTNSKIGKEEPSGIRGFPNLKYALELAKRGYVSLAPDYPSFGEYSYDFKAHPEYRSGTMKAIYDNMRSIDLLQSLDYVNRDKIGCIGHSLGGHNTMFTAAFDERIKALVSSCGFTRFHKYYGGKLKGWTSDRYMPLINSRYQNDPDLVPFDFTEIVAGFAPRAFLACSPISDSNFEVSGVRDVIQIAKPIYKLAGKEENLQAVYPKAGHDFPVETRETAYQFFDTHLK